MFKIADFNVDLKSKYTVFSQKAEEFLTNETKADFIISCSEEEIMQERISEKVTSHKYFLEFVAAYRKFAGQLPLRDAFVFHCACFDVEGTGVAFAAHSGTGKTTHMNLWQEYLGEKMTVVNGDKPIIRFFNDAPNVPYAYGTFWNGKEHLGCNMRTKLKHICFIERCETNYVERVEKSEIIDRIFNQVYMPKDPIAVMKTMELIDRLLSCCDLWIIHCNMEKEAAEVAYKAIFNA